MHHDELLRKCYLKLVDLESTTKAYYGDVSKLRQMLKAPEMFAQALVEGYRRRQFSTNFLSVSCISAVMLLYQQVMTDDM